MWVNLMNALILYILEWDLRFVKWIPRILNLNPCFESYLHAGFQIIIVILWFCTEPWFWNIKYKWSIVSWISDLFAFKIQVWIFVWWIIWLYRIKSLCWYEEFEYRNSRKVGWGMKKSEVELCFPIFLIYSIQF